MRTKNLPGNLLLLIAGMFFMGYSIQPYWLDRVGTTLLNGDGCVCHTLLFPSPEIFVKVEGPDTLFTGETATYKMFLAGGVAVGGGYNVAARFGTLGVVDTFSSYLGGEVMHNFPLLFPTLTDTIFWEFSYTAPANPIVDTLYSAGLTADMDDNPLTNDFWNFGDNFPVVVIDGSVPVELLNFSAALNNFSQVTLSWSTATEKNNSGFDIEISKDDILFNKVSFVSGKGTTTEKQEYSYVVPNLLPGYRFFRLKQIDLDGSFTFSESVELNVSLPDQFKLYQNHPNPFNPSTVIRFSLPSEADVTISILSVTGELIASVLENNFSPGVHSFNFNGSDYNLSSGIYFYTIDAAFRSGQRLSMTNKMLLLK